MGASLPLHDSYPVSEHSGGGPPHVLHPHPGTLGYYPPPQQQHANHCRGIQQTTLPTDFITAHVHTPSADVIPHLKQQASLDHHHRALGSAAGAAATPGGGHPPPSQPMAVPTQHAQQLTAYHGSAEHPVDLSSHRVGVNHHPHTTDAKANGHPLLPPAGPRELNGLNGGHIGAAGNVYHHGEHPRHHPYQPLQPAQPRHHLSSSSSVLGGKSIGGNTGELLGPVGVGIYTCNMHGCYNVNATINVFVFWGFLKVLNLEWVCSYNVRFGSRWSVFAIIQSCSHILNYYLWLHWLMDSELNSLGRMHVHYAANSATNNTNFIHQVTCLNPLK